MVKRFKNRRKPIKLFKEQIARMQGVRSTLKIVRKRFHLNNPTYQAVNVKYDGTSATGTRFYTVTYKKLGQPAEVISQRKREQDRASAFWR